MSDKRRLDDARKMMRRQGGPGAPSIERIEAEVRSDLNLPITSSPDIKGLKQARTTQVKQKAGHYVGTYILEWGFDVPKDGVADFHAWLAENEPLLASCPSGIAYRGTFVATFGPTNRPEGRYRTYWSLDNLSDLEKFAANGGGGAKKRFARLLTTFMSFRDSEKGSGYSQLYQVAAGTPQY